MRHPTALRSLIVLASVATLVACADRATPTAPSSRASSDSSLVSFAKGKGGKTVAVCKPQKEEWKTEQIGAKGGKVQVPGIELTIPPGALTRTIAITAHKLPTTSASVQFSPEGLLFARSATLRMDYSKCETPLFGVNVVYVQADTISAVMPSQNHPVLKFVAATIDHFSSYAVAY